MVLLSLWIHAAAPSGAAAVTLAPAQTYDVSGAQGPYAVVAATFGSDSNLDLAVANSTSSNVSILKGDGTGKVTSAINYPTGTAASPQSLVAGDFVGDSNVDLAVANHGDGTVLILTGAADGGFATTATSVAVGGSPQSIAAGKIFTSSTKPDLVVANAQDTGGNVIVMKNNGDGSFATSTVTAGTKPWSVAVGNVVTSDPSKKQDLVVTNFGSNNATVLPGNGDGSFATATTLTTGTGPISVALADLDKKGKLDIVTANNGSDNVSVFLNGDGGLATAATNIALAPGAKPFSVRSGDFDLDGKQDLVVSNEGTKNIATLPGNGDGSFASATLSAAGRPGADVLPGVLAVADFDGDLKPDVIVPNRNANATDNIAILTVGGGGTSGVTTTTAASSSTGTGTGGTGSGSSTSSGTGSSTGSSSPLAQTGAAIAKYFWTAVVLVGAGTFLVVSVRRRRRLS